MKIHPPRQMAKLNDGPHYKDRRPHAYKLAPWRAPVGHNSPWPIALFAFVAFVASFCCGWVYLVGDPFEKPGEAISSLSIRVIDGDTIDHLGERIRLPNLDAPEMPGRAACPEEAALALQAKAKLTETLRTGPLILLHRRSIAYRDQYGRTLARITVDGVDVAHTLRKAGVARRFGFISGWC